MLYGYPEGSLKEIRTAAKTPVIRAVSAELYRGKAIGRYIDFHLSNFISLGFL